MERNRLKKMLSLPQTIGFLQRFMIQRNAAEWLESDRRYSPLLSFRHIGDTILYDEDEVARFVKKLNGQAHIRGEASRRLQHSRRRIPVDRRHFSDRRYLRRQAAINNLDRRFAMRQDRRGDLDRRIRGWVDRRCVEGRRSLDLAGTSTHA